MQHLLLQIDILVTDTEIEPFALPEIMISLKLTQTVCSIGVNVFLRLNMQ